MPKKIQRLDPNGNAHEIVQHQFLDTTPDEIVLACMRLGQTETEAEETCEMYLEQILDTSDAALLEEKIREMRAQHQQEKALAPTFVQDVEKLGRSIASAHTNPRDPTQGVHKQKITRRDGAGRVIALEEIE